MLALDRLGERTFEERELEPVTLFANLAAIAIHNARQYEEAEKASKQLEEQLALSHELLSASSAVLSSLEQTEVLEHIADTLKQIVDYDTMDVRLVDAELGQLIAIYARDDEDEQEIFDFAIPIDEGISGWVVRNNEAQLINDMAKDPRAVYIPGTEVEEQQACILVPLSVGDEVIGIMTMDRLGGRTFEARELEPARLFANLAAIAIRNARQYDELETTSARLEGQLDLQHELMSISTLLLSSLDQREVFSRITTMLKDIVDYDAMDIRLLDESSRELVCIYSRDINAELNEQFRISIDEGLAGWVVRHDEAQLVNDMATTRAACTSPAPGRTCRRPASSSRCGCRARSPACSPWTASTAARSPATTSSRSCCSPTWRRSPSRTRAPTRRWSARPSATASPASTTTATSTSRFTPRSAAPGATATTSAC